MAPSFISDASRSIGSNAELMQSQSPLRSHRSCASDEDRQNELEHLRVADTVLADDKWEWLRELLDHLHDVTARQQGKTYFARLFTSHDAAEVEVTLSEMETWRQELGDKTARPQEHKLAHALFLLGYDKHLSLTTL